MKIIICVDFSSKEFNNDFNLSNALLQKHTVLLVTNIIQLNSAINKYDIVIKGKSCNYDLDCEYIDIKDNSIDNVFDLLDKKKIV